MMLATNKMIQGKEDVVQMMRTYMSRWSIEEYFRFKKNHFGFEDFRVRSLRSINNLNQLFKEPFVKKNNFTFMPVFLKVDKSKTILKATPNVYELISVNDA